MGMEPTWERGDGMGERTERVVIVLGLVAGLAVMSYEPYLQLAIGLITGIIGVAMRKRQVKGAEGVKRG